MHVFAHPKPTRRTCCSACMQGGISTPKTLCKATSRIQKLRWLVRRITKSRLLDGISRASLHKTVLHYWHVIGADRCTRALSGILSDEGQRASGDHTYHVVSNLTAYDDQGKPVVLKASLYSVLGQGVVLGIKVISIHLCPVCHVPIFSQDSPES